MHFLYEAFGKKSPKNQYIRRVVARNCKIENDPLRKLIKLVSFK